MIFKYKKTLIVIGFIFILCSMFIIYNQDDVLNPKIHDFLTLSGPVKANDGHAVLYALDAPVGVDVIELGQKRLDGFLNDSDYSIKHFEQPLAVELIDDSSCIKELERCFKEFKNGTQTFTEFGESEIELQNRIQIIQDNMPLLNVFNASYDDPIPNYRFILSFQNINFKRLMHLYLNGNEQQILDFLYAEIKLNRQQLSHSANLINKMIFTHLIKNNIQLLQLLSFDSKYQKALPNITFKEVDMASSFSYEYRYYYNLMMDLSSGERKMGLFTDEKTIFEPLLAKGFFKKNRTLNNHFNFITNQLWYEKELLETFLNKDFNEFISYDLSFSNYIGDTLNAVGAPAYSEYNFKVLELSCLISQYNKSLGHIENKPLVSDEQCNLISEKLNKDDKE
ncbi:MAG: hypothetical protein HRU38_15790 [Saccharospirillaceae bacterium]|nr:hypothetical protein [Pseudomonadales bacterium]NRB80103.1 hypothetical protein [Saccharospirillaceae bacterium]